MNMDKRPVHDYYWIAAIVFMICVLFSCNARAQTTCNDWSRKDIRKEVAYQTLHGLDWLQTKEIARNPDYIELNPILGQDPTQGEVDKYFMITGLLHAGVSCSLSKETREIWLNSSIMFQSIVVLSNIRKGIQFKIKF